MSWHGHIASLTQSHCLLWLECPDKINARCVRWQLENNHDSEYLSIKIRYLPDKINTGICQTYWLNNQLAVQQKRWMADFRAKEDYLVYHQKLKNYSKEYDLRCWWQSEYSKYGRDLIQKSARTQPIEDYTSKVDEKHYTWIQTFWWVDLRGWKLV
jgi:hypothetical protein